MWLSEFLYNYTHCCFGHNSCFNDPETVIGADELHEENSHRMLRNSNVL